MTPAVQLLLIQIMQISALLSVDPRYMVFVETAGHIRQIQVRIYPATSTWRQGFPAPKEIATASAYWEPYRSPWDDDEMYAAELQAAERKLSFMRAALHGYLPQPAPEAQAPAEQEAQEPELYSTLDDASLSAVQRLVLDGGDAELQLFTGPLSHTATLTVDRIDHPAGHGLEAELRIYKQRHALALKPGDGLYLARLCEWIEAAALGRLAAAA
ncbi:MULTISPECIES: hypothetical protein [unclassified Pseudomonas]|uniref:hypothetical protein n=1 Tax=unclassified Pseudomonas TaxID=196821 RepID=UPI002447BDAB|nr:MULTISPECIES: hypothetical protein [unclassified Pseudomonas]MDG9928509.1 hypothetical protein [Pseudomonas sp. GD04042]MDH0482679.1 hypothetical protein [Pseudomonas sp. GD04015]MDH0604619.1 hypothetical protein [Pseudomonas sp. GD03869]